ncbi:MULTISPECIES: DUF4124 domain-containing protein [Azospira]|uniref:DUF4124 domain-containing protein n=2 Tax=Azospira oryzae TaxID=146939 RepID=G8QJM6_AZOOP|nr:MULTISPECIES: DUF4124 domain-containing protein [Azospira]AEV25451.1 hypothetical protein Dsui_1049 [Azospira oryzae PS]MDK9690954.1 DUF4124 domain-containing protein [Azospira sp.]RZT76204.1 uncharacterized protein DUF4124 [Azospira oryzae]TLS17643.1 MAG: DUF4124 domain-containing protein [Betaproteobacteria bacterium]
MNTKLSRASLLASLLALGFVGPVRADIFKCTDDAGHITYANAPGKGCKRIITDPTNSAPSGGSRAPAKVSTPSPSDFPKVGSETQRSRDNDRRTILEQELAAEQKNLEAAKKELANQEANIQPTDRNVGGGINGAKVAERVQPYKDKVQLHERNIEAIRKEIGNLR